MEIYFPKVLVVSAAPINPVDATGITMSNLFAGWPTDRIAQIYDSPVAPDPLYCANANRFSGAEIGSVRAAKKIVGLLKRLKRKRAGLNGEKSPEILNSSVDLGLLASFSDVVPFQASNQMLKWAADFSPDVIYTLLGGSRICELVAQLSDHLAVPVLPHFMDDWPSTLYETQPLRNFFKRVMNKRLDLVLKRSPFGLAIGADMAGVLHARYGKKFDYFMNCVEFTDCMVKKNKRDLSLVRFGYVGGLHLNRWRSLLALAETLSSFEGGPHAISLEICAPPKDVLAYKDVFAPFASILRLTSIAPYEVADRLNGYDVLVHVESFVPEDVRYTKLSISTKIPQYMAASRPILAIGPHNLSSIRYVKSSKAGLVVTEAGVNSRLTAAIHSLVEFSDTRSQLGRAGYLVARENHDASSERRRFALVLEQAAARVTA